MKRSAFCLCLSVVGAALLLGAQTVSAAAPKAVETKPAERETRPVPGRLFEPDKSGVVLLMAMPDVDQSVMSNPFDVRVQPEVQTQEVILEVGGVIRSRDPSKNSALVNGKVYSTNDVVENGIRVYMVRRDDVIMEIDSKYVRIPRGSKVTVRLPHLGTL